ncbi:MAG: hypothetical protein ACUVXF_05880 [Desulfobaccales bacterium]
MAPGPRDYFRRGTFYYPHPRTGRPCPSLRLEMLRRGFQDYQYLVLLEEAGRRGLAGKEELTEIFHKVSRITENLPQNAFPVTMGELEALRQRMGEILDGISAEKGRS